MKIFDCHSHWGTKRGYIFRTEAELAQQEKIWKTKATFFTEDEQVAYFRQEQCQGHPRSLDHQIPSDRGDPGACTTTRWTCRRPTRTSSPATGCNSIPAVRSNRSGSSTGCMAACKGFVGLCVNGQVTRVSASDPIWDPFYQLSMEADRPIMILTGLTGHRAGLAGRQRLHSRPRPSAPHRRRGGALIRTSKCSPPVPPIRGRTRCSRSSLTSPT